MNNYRIKRLVDKDPVLCQKLKQWCYDLNGCCQEVQGVQAVVAVFVLYKDILMSLGAKHKPDKACC